MPLTKEQILSAKDCQTETVDVPEWGGSVLVRVMTGTQRDRFEAALLKDRSDNIRARLAACTICDDAGHLLFSEADILSLGDKNGSALTRVWEVAVRLNGIGNDDVEALAGNSKAIPSDSTPSA
jgi:hypothetical protein